MSTQLEFAVAGTGASQCDKILAYLRDRTGAWVPMPDLVVASDSFNIHSRISDLRKRGFTIEQKNEWNPRNPRQVKSFYRIVE